mmetsp:Transcript_56782/g.149405  ORF Transcript_56782/g.149405 Transcript_56782/m.149405 type:complete len:400 (-) Transcript_56782:57-1256(-)
MMLQAMVSLRGPLQAMPPLSGFWSISLERYLWPNWKSVQALHWAHAESSQSLGALHVVAHRFVASREPWHGSPSSLFATMMVRWRSHRPTQEGAFQSLHWLNTQSTAVLFPLQLWMKGHSATFSWVPVHLLLFPPLKKKASPFALGRRSMERLCSVVCLPQLAPQCSDSDHSPQVQKKSLAQSLVQFDVSFAAASSQGLPHWFGSFSMERCRKRCPPHCVQSPHADQASNWQSWQTIRSHGSALQGFVAATLDSHGLPPRFAGLATARFRSVWPPPHVAVHADQSSHKLISQSAGGSSLHWSGSCSPSWPELQVVIIFRASWLHSVPLPEAYVVMRRLLSRMPKHSQLHFDQAPHRDSWQSTSTTHGGSSEQTANSSRRPSTGLPQRFSCTSGVRRRDL